MPKTVTFGNGRTVTFQGGAKRSSAKTLAALRKRMAGMHPNMCKQAMMKWCEARVDTGKLSAKDQRACELML